MGDRDACAGAGVVMRRWLAGVRAAGRGTAATAGLALLATCLALGSVPAFSAWDANRMLQAAQALGAQAELGAKELRDVINRVRSRDTRARLEAVNDYFNRTLAYAEDITVWGKEDYWASPLEALGKGAGDCEDYAIAKYFSLIATGLPVRSLRLVYVRAMLPAMAGLPARSQPHMVLAWYEERSEDPLILDNLVGEIRRASQRPDLTPVFSFNGEGLWQGAGTQTAGDPMARLSKWRDVVRKAQAEGFE